MEICQEEAEIELALISKKIQRMMKIRDQIKKLFSNRKNGFKVEAKKSQVTCYGCNKMRHYKTECLMIKRKPKRFPFKNKSMIATWDDSEQEEEEINIFQMTNSETKEVTKF